MEVPSKWAEAWHALRDDVLSGVDGLDNDQVNTILGMLDNYEPVAASKPAAQPSDDVVLKAKRYDWLRQPKPQNSIAVHDPKGFRCFSYGLDEVIDAAMAQEKA